MRQVGLLLKHNNYIIIFALKTPVSQNIITPYSFFETLKMSSRGGGRWCSISKYSWLIIRFSGIRVKIL